MKNNWIDSVLSEQYQLVKVLKNTEKTQICVLQHKELRKRLVKRSIEGTGDVYFVLRNRFHPNISNVYEVFKRESGVTVLEEYIDGQTVSEYLSDDLYTPSGVKSVVS